MIAKIICRLSLFLFISIILSGCVNLSLPPEHGIRFLKQDAKVRAAQLGRIHGWDIKGAFSVQHHQKNEIANYQWRQNGKGVYQVNIESALDLYTMHITRKRGRVTIVLPSKTVIARSPEKLMKN